MMAASLQIPISVPRSTFLGRNLVRAFLLVAALALPIWHLHDMDRDFQLPLIHNDMIGRWLGTRAALHGQDPYSPQMTDQIQAIADHDTSEAFAYPASLVIVLAPLAIFSWKTFSVVYLLLIIPLLAIALWLCIRFLHLRITPGYAALIVFVALCSWPSFWGLRMWQPTLLAIALIFIALYLLTRDHDMAAGILLALATFKPQIVLPLVLWLAVWACMRRRWSFLASLAVTVTLLLAGAERIVPGWFPHWIAALHTYQAKFGELPLEPVLGHWLTLVVTAALGGWAAWRLWQNRNCPADSPQFARSIALVLAATLFTSYVWNVYNQMLLFPGCVLLVCTKRPGGNGLPVVIYRIAQALLVWTFVSVPLGIVTEAIWHSRIVCDCLPFRNPLLPFLIALFLLMDTPRSEGRSSATSARMAAQIT